MPHLTTLKEDHVNTPVPVPPSLALELTGKCQLACMHCYAQSGPDGSHGPMTLIDWKGVIGQAKALGVRGIQFIGGEPTMHPGFVDLLQYAIDAGHGVEVYSNLVHVDEDLWPLLACERVSIATSYYSPSQREHGQITRRPRALARTRNNIARAVGLGIPIRAGVVQVLDSQQVDAAMQDLVGLGVPEQRIAVDRMRHIGRPAPEARDVHQLCGRCGTTTAAVLPNGDVVPCTMSRWMTAGNVKEKLLADIFDSTQWLQQLSKIPARANRCDPIGQCSPSDVCTPQDSNDCDPANRPACQPDWEKPLYREDI